MASLIGVSDDVLGYWMREGLLVPSSGGEGRGRHRRFDFVQVNIAAVYGQLRRFGLNIASLRSLAELLQSAATLGASFKLHPYSYGQAAELAATLHRFRAGKEVLIPIDRGDEKPPANLSRNALYEWRYSKRPAENEREVVELLTRHKDDYDPAHVLLSAAEAMGPDKEIVSRVYQDLVYEILSPGFAASYSWLLSIEPGKPCRIEHGFDGAKFFETRHSSSAEEFGPAIFLPVSWLFLRIWNLKTPADHRRDREQEIIAELLAKAGIQATVIVSGDEDESFSIDAPDVEWSAVVAALKGTRYAIESAEESQA